MRITLQPKREGWLRWFAWYPVYIDNTIVWLEFIYRKSDWDDYDSMYQYSFNGIC